MGKPSRFGKRPGTGDNSKGMRCLTMVKIFTAGLVGGAMISSSMQPVNRKACSGDAAAVTASVATDTTLRSTTKSIESATRTNTQKQEQVVDFCHHNPYQTSLQPAHTFESAESQAKVWMANKTAIRDDLYFKYNGQHTHGKFDVFQVMAPCNYQCTGPCKADTSKIVCGSETLQPGCVVYSIGGNNNWDFEQKMYDMTPCEIHTFDCTGPITRFQPPARIKDRHHFHHVCLATADIPPVEHPERIRHVAPDFSVVGAMETLETMQQRLGHDRLDLLKLDIEGFEWPIFNSWPELSDLEKSSKVALPMQILVEVHYRTAMHDLWPQKGVIFVSLASGV